MANPGSRARKRSADSRTASGHGPGASRRAASVARRRGDAHGTVPSVVETATRLHAAAVHVLRRLSPTDQRLGLSPARLSALSVLVLGGPRTIGELAAAERVTPPTMTRLVAAMEADGLLERAPHPTDRRAVRVAATDKGARLVRRGRDHRLEALVSALDGATLDDLATVAKATEVVERVLAEQPRG